MTEQPPVRTELTAEVQRRSLTNRELDVDEIVDKRPAGTSLTAPIVATILVFPIGLVALVNALRYRSSVRSGNPEVRFAVRARDWSSYAFGATLLLSVIAGICWFALVNDRAVLRAYVDIPTLRQTLPDIFHAFLQNLSLSVFAEIGAVTWALILAVGRMLPGKAFLPVRWLIIGYVDLFRSLPALLTILLIGFGLPSTGIPLFVNMSLYQTGILALTIVYGAYISEIFRSAIEAIPPGQLAAARALGFGFFGSMRSVILPQAFRIALPELMNWYIAVLKDTSLLSVIGLVEGLTQSRIQVIHLSNMTPMIGISLCFIAVTLPLARLTDYFMMRSAHARRGRS